MKKYLLSFALACMSLTAFAQTDYEKIMTEKIAKIETCKTPEDFQTLANDFERIGSKESSQWLPPYYAAFSQIQKGRVMMRNGNMQELDGVASQAEKFLGLAQSLAGADNAEIHLLKKMANSLRMMVNPAQRFMTDGARASEELNIAEKLDAANPRIALIKAEDIYFTPEQYGGSKTKGLELFKEALVKYNNYKLKTALDPNWGRSEAEYFISLPVEKTK
ncbi:MULTISPECIES: hypothetical protein [Chryseobacterium]|uniref:Uncharacterized protein n=1 Tax=Chryseobacterium rhizosphaerae TaxID=395937 RepID=A0AAE4C3J7_9FLAO|nr:MULTISPECIES: hypothetical protein [Chryseobacterium]MDC8102437.1 hypothetical protein [Chryseobacterium rhizosphaerae]MDR6526654.1 hypothetical protein [Chryseobacterium rhizosphaerae]MDR6544766.1 hypothetical protein [Chryseobacterium rhizosphaerae]REC74165.1 hypothetical protein DRF57_15265 [Chryseobacterium rhizosphaerae]SMC72913.1 hypothetical protein SAMN02787074_2665 [Chryseobacterium sp. YR221]